MISKDVHSIFRNYTTTGGINPIGSCGLVRSRMKMLCNRFSVSVKALYAILKEYESALSRGREGLYFVLQMFLVHLREMNLLAMISTLISPMNKA